MIFHLLEDPGPNPQSSETVLCTTCTSEAAWSNRVQNKSIRRCSKLAAATRYLKLKFRYADNLLQSRILTGVWDCFFIIILFKKVINTLYYETKSAKKWAFPSSQLFSTIVKITKFSMTEVNLLIQVPVAVQLFQFHKQLDTAAKR